MDIGLGGESAQGSVMHPLPAPNPRAFTLMVVALKLCRWKPENYRIALVLRGRLRG